MTKFYFLLLIGIHAEDLETGSSKLKESKAGTSVHEDYKLLLDVHFDLKAEDLINEFWNADSALWAQVLKKNQLSKLIISDKSEMGMKTDMEVAMSMPMGMSMGFPTEAIIQSKHTFGEVTIGDRIIKTNEVENRMIDFPFADYFDIVERFEFEEVGDNETQFRFYSRQNWLQELPMAMIQGFIDTFLENKQTLFVEGLEEIVRAWIKSNSTL